MPTGAGVTRSRMKQTEQGLFGLVYCANAAFLNHTNPVCHFLVKRRPCYRVIISNKLS